MWIDARRKALDALDAQRHNEIGHAQQRTEAGEDDDSPAATKLHLIAASTSQRTSQSVWAASVERGKLLMATLTE
jgi:hypothetical protein